MVEQLPREQFSAEDFIQRVVPSDGYLLIAWKEGEYFRHKPFEDRKEAVHFGTQQSFQRRDVYFATASYKQGFHRAPDGKLLIRTQDNVLSVKSLWVDIDVGKGGYKDSKEVINALAVFVRDTGIPFPTVLLHSGNGFHAYWVFDKPLPKSGWARLSNALKAACLGKGFKIDPVCTADAARILRLPGTRNYKNPSKPQGVEVLSVLRTDYTVEEIESALAPWLDPLPATFAFSKGDAAECLEEFTSGVAAKHEPSRMEFIVKRCDVLGGVAATHGSECSEPQWVAVLQVAKFCDDGEQWIHPLSDGHPGYSHQSTVHKFTQRLDNSAGPTLCGRFGELFPEGCKTCVHKGRIKSPITLGREEYRDPHDVPFPYRVRDGRIYLFTRDKKDEEAAEWVRHLDFAVTDLEVYEFEDGKLAYDFTLRGRGPKTKVMIPAATFGSPELRPTFSQYGYHLSSKEDGARLAAFMKTWQEQLYAIKAVKRGIRHLGWQDESHAFCVGDTNYYPDGTKTEGLHPPREFENYAKNYNASGSLELWRGQANHLVRQGLPGLAATVASAFAAPLLRFTGNGGFSISVVSNDSGMGKSTAMKIAQSVWANPGAISSINDTENAVTHKLGFLKNLPAYWDEIRGEQAMDALAKVVFRISEGKSKARLSSSAVLQMEYHWDTVLLSASNSSLLEHIACGDQHTDAGILRIFEFQLADSLEGLQPPDLSVIRDNYGLAGRAYGEFLAKNSEKVKDDVRALREHYNESHDPKPRERFWFDALVTLLLGASYARKLELVDFNLGELREYLEGVLLSLREEHRTVRDDRTPVSILVRYVHEFFAERLVTDHSGGLIPKDITVKYSPSRHSPVFQIAEADRVLLIQRGHFRDWAQGKGYPASLFKLISSLPCVTETQPMSIGARTPYKQGRSRCWQVDLSADPLLGSLVDDNS